jgi:preprotein translocase subunit SecA
MSRASILAAGSALASGRPYAELREDPGSWHDRLAEFLYRITIGPLRSRARNSPRRLGSIVEKVDSHERALRLLSDAELVTRVQRMRAQLRQQGFAPALVAECFALVRESAGRTLGKRHYASQLMAGWALVNGRLVEMATGEGKTFAATLAASTMALAGYPVHVITVNDYLASRDAQNMAPLYRFLGLTVGTVVQGMPSPARRQAYAQSIAYCTNKELAFDYLRDRVALEGRKSQLHRALSRLQSADLREDPLVLRGLYYGLVDEADSVFIDEARTPLILSASAGSADEAVDCARALELARRLSAPAHYTLDSFRRSVVLTEQGKARLDECAAELAGLWASERAREEMVTRALSALLLFHRDEHYMVSEGKVQIIDESTGRVMPDRSWERGLHQLIEAKEGCALTERRDTLARITYQRLFRRYVRLAGMSGTAAEVAGEIRSVYRLDVARVPLHRPSRRVHREPVVCTTLHEKWQKVAGVAEDMARAGRPVLIGTRSVRASEEVSAVLAARGIAHALLNAKQDASEAEVIERAGEPGRVTVATNMAGRGTDIVLGPGVAERGGLHVILTEYHESRRIDRQLLGRCARQGDPGSCDAIVSLQDDIFTQCVPQATRLLEQFVQQGKQLPPVACRTLKRLAQFIAERRNTALRMQNLKQDQRLNQMLAFSGRGE